MADVVEVVHEGAGWEAHDAEGRTVESGAGDVLEAAEVAEARGLRLDRVLVGGCRTFWTTGR